MGSSSLVSECSLLSLPQIKNPSGNISPIISNIQISFKIKRVYYLYDIPGGESRGGHAHKELYQLIIAASGSFDVLLDDSVNKMVFNLNRPNLGLYVVPGIWRELTNFSSGSICLVLSSHIYDEADYIRDYEEFKYFKNR